MPLALIRFVVMRCAWILSTAVEPETGQKDSALIAIYLS